MIGQCRITLLSKLAYGTGPALNTIKLSDEIGVLRLAIWQCYCLHVGETASLIIHHFRYLCKLINDDLLFMCTCIFFNLGSFIKICYMMHTSLIRRWQVGVIKRSWWSTSWFVVIWIKQTVRGYQEVMMKKTYIYIARKKKEKKKWQIFWN